MIASRLPLKRQQKGFTIVELMIATLVFSTVLLVVTVGIIQITRVYYKGLNEAATQDTVRSIADTISQSIQFGGGDVTPTPGRTLNTVSFCVGNTQYTYRSGYQLVDGTPDNSNGKHQSNQGLISRTLPGCNGASPNASTGREMLSPKMRLSELTVKQDANEPDLYKITVRVAFGDDDLLNDSTGPKPTCKSTAGSQFCSVSELTTTVVKRIGNN
jgi:prepilin-type N-terminal cleavage/methylation domain-containing protein